ncbi:hypothetical protein [Roseovarius sp.]|uniref:hypothetical protein n=1 Tax=Roseovarius sp. TaxID=1486281 RepID=UPI003BAC84E4
MSAAGDDRIPLASVLSNTAQLLEVLSDKAAEIDEAVGDWLVSGDGTRPPLALLQDVDLMRQSVDCLRILTANLARQDLEDCNISVVEAVDGIYLESIRSGCRRI